MEATSKKCIVYHLRKKQGRSISRNRQRAAINLEGPKLANCVMSDIEEIKNMAPEAPRVCK